MVDPITIATIVGVFFTGLIQIVQMCLDYKRDELNGHDKIYQTKTYQSSCCNITIDSDNEETN